MSFQLTVSPDRSLVTLPLVGIPASLAIAYVHVSVFLSNSCPLSNKTFPRRYGVVYMFCTVGVYV